jgi:hypothetical protein
MVKEIRWKCPNCSSVLEAKDAMTMVLAKSFIPIEVDLGEPRPATKPELNRNLPRPRLAEYIEEPEEEIESLSE